MKRRHALVLAGVVIGSFAVACVDLFHDTDFETLCTHAPDAAQCGDADAAKAPEAVADSAVDARRPHPDFCAWSTEEARAQALRACAWLGACEGPLGESAFGPCVVRAQLAYDCAANPALRPAGRADELWSCLATVRTCGEVDQCVFPGAVQPCPAFAAGSYSACGASPGSPRVRCVAGPEQRAAGVEPCAISGRQCVATDKSGASCGGSVGLDCSTTSRCLGSSAVDCTIVATRAFDQGVDCASVGAGACGSDDAGVPFCAPTASTPSCAEPDPQAPACLGDVLQACIGGKAIRIDCSKLGLVCDVSGVVPAYDLGAACIRRAGNPCTQSDTCEGAQITSCGRGSSYTVDCGAIGLKSCLIKDGRVACAPP